MMNPQNPYASFVVSASAGSGKTYQLTQRFLALAAAGAEPDHILTITFTRKAAHEMRQRIIDEAQRLAVDGERQKAFDEQLYGFYQSARDGLQEQLNYRLMPPLKAAVVAEKILMASQRLRISTIDSVFMDWVRQFLWEAGGGEPYPAHWDVASKLQMSKVDKQVWQAWCRAVPMTDPIWQELDGLSVRDIQERITTAERFRSFFYYQSLRSDGAQGWSHFALPTDAPLTESACLENSRTAWLELAEVMPKYAAAIHAALSAQSLEPLKAIRLITSKWEISGSLVRQNNRDRLSAAIQCIEEQLQGFCNGQRLRRLNQQAQALRRIYEFIATERWRLKSERGILDFDDVARGALQIFSHADNFGAQFLVHKQVQHLMLDEFQDTSALQWGIFSEIAIEKLAGLGLHQQSGGVLPSVFIVGDEKQSIYGFREADPRILRAAAQELKTYGVHLLPLNHSYRSSPLILDYVNQVFKDWQTFADHEAAERSDGSHVIADIGSVTVMEPFVATATTTGRVREAQFVAQWLSDTLSGSEPLIVFDKAAQALRPVTPADCVILYRQATHAGVYEQALRAKGIACQREEGDGFLTRPEIRDCLALLRILACPLDVAAWSVVLKAPWIGVDDADLLEALTISRDDHALNRWQVMLKHLTLKYSDVIASVQAWHVRYADGALTDALWEFFSLFQVDARYRKCWQKADADLAAANRRKFLERTRLWTRDGLVTPLAQWARWQSLQDVGESEAGVLTSSQTVKLMTIHKAKGLEFPVVIVVDTGNAWWENQDHYWVKAYESGAASGVYYVGTKSEQPHKHLAFQQVVDSVITENQEESRRLLYVALTRASHHLLITAHQTQALKPLAGFFPQLLEAVQAHPDRQQELIYDATAHRIESRRAYEQFPTAPAVEAEAAVVASLPQPQAPSRHLAEVYVLRPARLLLQREHAAETSVEVPEWRRQEAQRVGIYIHAALEHALGKKSWRSEQMWQKLGLPGLNVQPILDAEWQDALQTPEWQRLQREADQVLVEQPFVLQHGQELVRGVIDLVAQMPDGELWVVDYKTTVDRPAAHNEAAWQEWAQMHQYHEQLRLYREAVQRIYPRATVRTAVFLTYWRQWLWL